MAWDGVPEHRNLHGSDPDAPPPLLGSKERGEYLRRILRETARAPHPPREDAAAAPGMPADPVGGLLSSTIALAEILHSLIEGGMSEPQALYYLACLSHVRLAMLTGRFDPDLPPWPPEAP